MSRPSKWPLFALTLLSVVLFVTPAQARRVITPEFDTHVQMRAGGRDVLFTGPLTCTRGDTWEIEATITQANVKGDGRNDGACKGDLQEWSVRAATEGDENFVDGAARGCAVLR